MGFPQPSRVATRWLLAYAPDVSAPKGGEWDRSGPDPRWRQAHLELVAGALRSWKGDPVTMRLHMRDEETGDPEPGSGSGKIQRAQARALMWEMEHNSRPSPKPLYRGSHLEPKGFQSWSEKKSVATHWAGKNNGKVYTVPKGTRGLRVEDYTNSAFDAEKEWVLKT